MLSRDGLRRYALRDWGAPERMARRARAALPVAQKVALAVALYEAARSTNPDWPNDAERLRDLQSHLEFRKKLRRAVHVGAR